MLEIRRALLAQIEATASDVMDDIRKDAAMGHLSASARARVAARLKEARPGYLSPDRPTTIDQFPDVPGGPGMGAYPGHLSPDEPPIDFALSPPWCPDPDIVYHDDAKRFQRELRKQEAEPDRLTTVSPTFRAATVDEYVAWLKRWIAAGNKPTHYYDYPFDRWTCLTALRDFTTGGECGARSVQIIVPKDVRHLGGDLGHNELFFMGGPRHVGFVVPVFSDPVFETLGLEDFIAQQRAISHANRAELAAQLRRADLASSRSDIGRYADQPTCAPCDKPVALDDTQESAVQPVRPCSPDWDPDAVSVLASGHAGWCCACGADSWLQEHATPEEARGAFLRHKYNLPMFEAPKKRKRRVSLPRWEAVAVCAMVGSAVSGVSSLVAGVLGWDGVAVAFGAAMGVLGIAVLMTAPFVLAGLRR